MTAQKILFITQALSNQQMAEQENIIRTIEEAGFVVEACNSLPVGAERIKQLLSVNTPIDAVLIGAPLQTFIHAVQKLHRIDSYLEFILLCHSHEQPELQRQLQYASLGGIYWTLGIMDERKQLLSVVKDATRVSF